MVPSYFKKKKVYGPKSTTKPNFVITFFFSGNESSSNLHWLDDSVPKPKTAKSKDKFQKENLLSFNRRYDMGFVNTVLTYIQNSFH